MLRQTALDALKHSLERAPYVLVALLLLAPIWLVGPFPTYDGPQHAWMGYMLNHIGDPEHALHARYLELQWCYSGLYGALVIALFEHLLPLQLAVKAMLSLTVLLQGSAIWQLAKRPDGRPSSVSWLAVVAPYTYIFWMGFDAFNGAMGIGLWCVVLLVRGLEDPEKGEPPWLRIGALLLLTAVAHAFAAALTGLVLGGLLLLNGRRVLTRLGRLLLASVPTLTLLVLVARAAATHQGEPFWTQLAFDPANLLRIHRDGFETPFGQLWAANAAFLVGASLATVALARGSGPRRAMALTALVMVACLLVVPIRVDSWQQLPIRLVPYIVALSIAAGAHTRLAGWRWLALPLIGLVAFSTVRVTRDNAELAELQEEFTAGFGAVSDRPRAYFFRVGAPIYGEPDSYLAGNLHILYMLEEDVIFPFLFRNRRDNHVLRETAAWSELEVVSEPNEQALPERMRWEFRARLGLHFDQVRVWDPPPGAIDHFLALGYEHVVNERRLHRLVPETRRVEVLASPGQRPRYVTATFGNLLWPFAACPIAPETAADSATPCLLERLPSAPVHVSWYEQQGSRPNPQTDPRIGYREVDLSEGDGAVTFATVEAPQP